MQATSPAPSAAVQREIVLIGGGHSHVAVVRAFGMHPVPGLQLTLVTRDVHTPYSGMLPGLVAGHYAWDECHIDLRPLCEANGVRLIHACVSGIDPEAQRVLVEGREPLRYDWASINIGSRPGLAGIDGAAEHGVSVKPVDGFLDHWTVLLEQLRREPRPCTALVVGGGAAGVEIALACAHRAQQTLGADAACLRVEIASASPLLLPSHNARVRRYFAALLERRGIRVHLGARACAADSGGVTLEDGARLRADSVIWATQASAAAWPARSGIACDPDGFVRVDSGLRSISHPAIHAAGDIAALPAPCPKSGVYAVREGQRLASNLRRAALGQAPLPFRPQRRFLSLISTGDRCAVASRGPFFAAGAWAWRWKDRIDRRFMAMYRADPAPAPASDADPLMRCGGCAAKIGGDALGRVLAGLSRPARAGVEAGIEQAEDAAVLNPPAGKRLLQSVDYFRAFIDDPFIVGQVAAVHALGDLLAMGAQPHSALAIATVPYAGAPVMEQTLRQLMQGALLTLDGEGVALIGGHSSEGAELAFGLSVNGFAEPADILYKSGLRPGHALVLSKALGTGTLLAANAAAAARGRWIDGALANMTRSSSRAAAILREHGAAACTDVTGFGLLGHLHEMLRASGIGARLDAAAVPVLEGARECLARGYRSSLHDSNRRSFSAWLDTPSASGSSACDILFDPQTAGGLLAAIPLARAAACVAALRRAGYTDAALVAETDALTAPGRLALR